MTFNEREKSKNVLNVVFLNVTKNKTLSRNKREILEYLDSMFQLVEMQVIILKREIRVTFESFYEKSQRSMKTFIKKLQVKDD